MNLIYDVTNKKQKVVEILKNKLNISSRLLIKLKNAGAIYHNDKIIFVNEYVEDGKIIVKLDKVDIEDNEKIKMYQTLELDLSELNIIYEDEYLLAINKQTNMPVHPTALHQGDTLLELVGKYVYTSNRYGKYKGKLHIVNRLDRETSGVVIIAKHAYIQECISKQMQEGKTEKEYIAVVDKIPKKEKDIIEKNIARKEGSIIERCISEDGEYAKTEYKIISIKEDYSVLKVKIYTGRTHQIRVHLKSIGNSILGDGLYNNSEEKYKYISRVALHAEKLIFFHPITNKKMQIIAEIPEDIEKII